MNFVYAKLIKKSSLLCYLDAEVLALGSQYRNVENTFTEYSLSTRKGLNVNIQIILSSTSTWSFPPTYCSTNHTIIIHRSDVEKLLQFPKKPRDQLIHELAAYMGFRTGEINTVRIEWLDVETGKCYVMDSKKRVLYPIPLNYEIARLAAKVADGRTEGLLIRKFQTGRPRTHETDVSMTGDAVWDVVRRSARKAGIRNWRDYNPRLLRHYFAATFAIGRDGKPGNLEVLRRILRHSKLLSLQFYLARLFFFEDVQEEYDRIHSLPVKEMKKLNENLFSGQCSKCPARQVCKYVEEAVTSEWADGCKFYHEIVEEAKH